MAINRYASPKVFLFVVAMSVWLACSRLSIQWLCETFSSLGEHECRRVIGDARLRAAGRGLSRSAAGGAGGGGGGGHEGGPSLERTTPPPHKAGFFVPTGKTAAKPAHDGGSPPAPPPSLGQSSDDRSEMLMLITTYCLPKLICELYSLDYGHKMSDSERSLMSLIGHTSLSGANSKYHFAAHMGQLIRGVEGNGCHHFYPNCPFSGDDVRQIAKKINVK